MIALPFVGLYKFLRWGFTNGTKGYIGLVIFGIVVIVMLCLIFSWTKGCGGEDEPWLTGIPDKLTAPYRIDTWSRVYYAEEAWEDVDGNVTMTNYWELRGEEWVFHEESFPFGEDFGKVEITERR